MDRERPRRQAGFNSRQLRTSDPIGSRPDRVAFWAVVLAVVVLVFAAGTGRAAAGGIGASTAPGGTTPAPSAPTTDMATYFGPGLYGNTMACGERLTRATVGVAHRTLPCGTTVNFRYQGASLRTTVVDRGPFVKGITWDLTSAAATKLGFTYTDEVKARIVG